MISMINYTEKITAPLDAGSVRNMNRVTPPDGSKAKTGAAGSTHGGTMGNTPPVKPTQQVKKTPRLVYPVSKGMKKEISADGNISRDGNVSRLRAGFGWNVKDPRCDVDISAFLLRGGRVLSDDWFVFYGQTSSPDGSVNYITAEDEDRRAFTVDFSRLDPNVEKIVFAVTIDEAKSRQLNFGMLSDVYIRILCNNAEAVSYSPEDYYPNVISMVLGEIYSYKGQWKFNAVGNGIGEDLAGLCRFYGVNIE